MKSAFLVLCLSAISIFTRAQQVPKPLPASAEIKNNMISFYKWYAANWKSVAAFKLYKSKKGKEGPPYVIDWPVAEAYFTYLRKNAPFLGEAFFKGERKAFKEIEAAFVKYPKDELPAGFDYDRLTDTQEDPKWFLAEMSKQSNTWTATVAGDKANVVVRSKGDKKISAEPWDLFCGKVAKENGVWKLAKIGCEATVLEQN